MTTDLAVHLVVAVLIIAAIMFLLLAAFNPDSEIGFGWVGLACLVAASWLLPSLLVAGHMIAATP